MIYAMIVVGAFIAGVLLHGAISNYVSGLKMKAEQKIETNVDKL